MGRQGSSSGGQEARRTPTLARLYFIPRPRALHMEMGGADVQISALAVPPAATDGHSHAVDRGRERQGDYQPQGQPSHRRIECGLKVRAVLAPGGRRALALHAL